jgi:hypothetical protein
MIDCPITWINVADHAIIAVTLIVLVGFVVWGVVKTYLQ